MIQLWWPITGRMGDQVVVKSQLPRAELQVKAQLSTVEGMPCHVAACDDHELKKNNEMMNIVWCVL